MTQKSDLKLVIGIATLGRMSIVQRTINDIRRQTRLPDKIIVCPVNAEDDLGGSCFVDPMLSSRFEVVSANKGLCFQRNAILRASEDYDVILFLDDDFVMQEDFCKNLLATFVMSDDIVGVTGHVIADGVTSAGIEFEAAVEKVMNFDLQKSPDYIHENVTTYGCNMAFRLRTVRDGGFWFDQELPLYAWFEDVDFSARLAARGRIIKTGNLIGVHMGHKGGRTKGTRLGYSQVANPIYLGRKGSLKPLQVFNVIIRRIIANAVKIFTPEPWVDRRGRLWGNLRALKDLLRGTIHPNNILDME